MLTKDQYKDLTKNWSKHGTVYQLYNRYTVRFPMLLKHIDVFKGKNVLEVGCNAGLAAYHIAQVADSYTGVEAEKGYWNQALETNKKIHEDNTKDVDTAFLNMSIKSYMKRVLRGDFPIDVNAVYLSYVLYHFSDKEVQMFENHILPELDVIVVQSRYAKRNKKGRRKHNSYGFWHPKNVVKFLEKNGFTTTLEWGPDKKFHFIIGKNEVYRVHINGAPDVKPLPKLETIDDYRKATKTINKKLAEIPKAVVREDNRETATQAQMKMRGFVGNVDESVEIDDKTFDAIVKVTEKEEKADGDQGSESGVLTDKKNNKIIKEGNKIPELKKQVDRATLIGPIPLKEKEKADGDQGSGGKHSKGTRKSSSRQGAPNRQKRTSKGMSFDDAKREADPTGEGQTLLPKRRRGRRPSVLLDGVEKGAENKVRSKNVSKTKQTSRTRAVSTGRKDNKSEDKPAVQKSETQS